MKEKKKLAQDPDVRKEPGSQPKKYYKTLSKDVKQKRSDFFKKQDTSDTSPGSYKAAPGDDKAKTKTSKAAINAIYQKSSTLPYFSSISS